MTPWPVDAAAAMAGSWDSTATGDRAGRNPVAPATPFCPNRASSLSVGFLCLQAAARQLRDSPHAATNVLPQAVNKRSTNPSRTPNSRPAIAMCRPCPAPTTSPASACSHRHLPCWPKSIATAFQSAPDRCLSVRKASRRIGLRKSFD